MKQKEKTPQVVFKGARPDSSIYGGVPLLSHMLCIDPQLDFMDFGPRRRKAGVPRRKDPTYIELQCVQSGPFTLVRLQHTFSIGMKMPDGAFYPGQSITLTGVGFAVKNPMDRWNKKDGHDRAYARAKEDIAKQRRAILAKGKPVIVF